MRIGHATHRGMVRESNEDSYLVLTAPALAPGLDALLVLADGMGGHQAGDVASSEVIRLLYDLFSSPLYQAHVGYNPQREDYHVIVVKEVLEEVNEHLYNLQASHADLSEMGTTGSVALLARGQLTIGHVGDSRIYLLRGGALRQVTHDHSWVAEQVEAGALSPQEAALHPKRNRLTRCLGRSLVLRVERTTFPVQPGDVILLCSDGLTNVVSDSEIAQVLTIHPGPQAACDRLIDLANQRGGPDNVTVLMAAVGERDGSDLPGGRAFGPQGKEIIRPVAAQQVDTLKLMRPQPPTRREARQGRSRPPAVGRRLRAASLAALLGCVISLMCAALGREVLSWPHMSALPAIELIVIFVACMVGVMTGLGLSGLFATGRSRGRQPPVLQDRDGDLPKT